MSDVSVYLYIFRTRITINIDIIMEKKLFAFILIFVTECLCGMTGGAGRVIKGISKLPRIQPISL